MHESVEDVLLDFDGEGGFGVNKKFVDIHEVKVGSLPLASFEKHQE